MKEAFQIRPAGKPAQFVQPVARTPWNPSQLAKRRFFSSYEGQPNEFVNGTSQKSGLAAMREAKRLEKQDHLTEKALVQSVKGSDAMHANDGLVVSFGNSVQQDAISKKSERLIRQGDLSYGAV